MTKGNATEVPPSNAHEDDFFAIGKENHVGIFVLDVIEAVGVPPMDMNGYSDPYVILKFGKKELRSPIKKKTLHPVWNHQFRFLISSTEINYDLTLELWDFDKLSSDDFISKINISLSDFSGPDKAITKHELLVPFDVPEKKRKKVHEKSLISLCAQYLPRDHLSLQFWKGIVEYFDVDQSGFIEMEELHDMLLGIHCDSDAVEHIADRELFEKIDKNGDGVITPEELHVFMSNKEEPIARKLFHVNESIMWKVFLAMNQGTTVGELVVDQWRVAPNRAGLSVVQENKELSQQILVQVRNSGKLEVELIPNYIRVSMKLMYSNRIGRATTARVASILRRMTIRQGHAYTNPNSKREILKFAQFHHLNLDEMAESSIDNFPNFNEFFYRKLKAGARPIDSKDDSRVAVSPSDCRMNVYVTIEHAQEIWIKGTKFTLPRLLQNEELAAKFVHCAVVIARLAPQDYHRYHSPVTGKILSMQPIDGTFYTVNPIAINQRIDVYGGNKRLNVVIDTEDFGEVCFVAIGATMVGSINMTVNVGDTVKKGDELGYFAFGGSTCLVLFRQGTIALDEDLIINSAKPIETLVAVGNHIGVATGKK